MDQEIDQLMNKAMPIATAIAKNLDAAAERHPDVKGVVILLALRMVRNRQLQQWGPNLRRQMEDLERRLDKETIGASSSLIVV